MGDISRIDDVFEQSSNILQSVRTVFNEVGHTLPDREYVIVGTPAFDCEQLTVSFASMGSGLPDQDQPRAAACMDPRNATYLIDIVRKLPQGKGTKSSAPIVPSPERITDTAKTQMRDAKLLADACDIIMQSQFIPGGSYSIIVGEASGFYQAVSAEIRLAI